MEEEYKEIQNHNHEKLQITTQLLDDCRSNGIDIRIFGSMALLLMGEKLDRKIKDIDIIINPSQKHLDKLTSYLIENHRVISCQHTAITQPYKRRYLFSYLHDNHFDIFIGNITLCQELKVMKRFNKSYPTLSITDLLLTKIQKEVLSQNDLKDINMILNISPIDVDYITNLCTNRWRWYKTFEKNIQQIIISNNGKVSQTNISNLIKLMENINDTPKPFKWKFRNLFGESLEWQNIVE